MKRPARRIARRNQAADNSAAEQSNIRSARNGHPPSGCGERPDCIACRCPTSNWSDYISGILLYPYVEEGKKARAERSCFFKNLVSGLLDLDPVTSVNFLAGAGDDDRCRPFFYVKHNGFANNLSQIGGTLFSDITSSDFLVVRLFARLSG